ncbi:MAG: hypothetical protein L6407_08360, partial [Candidatus Delongbacteria bacterium]|nr:hypothetical protein [Candidatus Delongbacteria bacterium]
FFVSWLFYSSKVDKMKSSYDFKVELIKGKIDYLQDKNKILEDKLARIKEFVKTDEESGKAPEEK